MTSLITIAVPREYGYVLLTAAASYGLSIWLGARIRKYRVAAGVEHPHVYASRDDIGKATSDKEKRALYLFNCAQRAHHNTMENYPAVITGMLAAGLWYPRLSAALGAAWVAGRVIYAFAYASTREDNQDGSGRFFYGGFHLAAVTQVALLGLVGKIGVDLLRA